MTHVDAAVREFFDRYADALLARDERAVAAMYAIPSLIVFPGNRVAVAQQSQTEEFFASAWTQYEGVDEVEHEVSIMGLAPHSIWADVTWTYDGRPQERFCYQLVGEPSHYQIAVLTPMETPS